jgi:hypothetical protein
MNLHKLWHRFAPWICPYCGWRWAVLLLLCAGCASQKPQTIGDKLRAAMPPKPVATEARAAAVIQPKQHFLAWDNSTDLYQVQFEATQDLATWYGHGYATAGATSYRMPTDKPQEFFRCRYVLPDGTYSDWNTK